MSRLFVDPVVIDDYLRRERKKPIQEEIRIHVPMPYGNPEEDEKREKHHSGDYRIPQDDIYRDGVTIISLDE
ncbi:hypothetical protein HOI26_05675 [Candidatus Woesearchaeota archaeon]|jgi:hypothetical protein|nr:hypothetical protein [Candidatus Woesearchaeota archaeon]MBT5740556.1 hypothetical protein [Candidatus Woesearchaeota archaeon]